MSIENKFARVMRDTGPARFFIPAGIILLVFGIILLAMNTGKYVETQGKIAEVTELPVDVTDEDRSVKYDLKVTYTVDGKDYDTVFSGMSGSYKTGDSIKVFYDPADPSKTTNAKMGFLGPVLIGVGALALVFGVYKTVTAFRKSKELDRTAGGSFPTGAFENFKTAAGVTEYYFRFDGNSLKPGYIVEDAARNIIFEGKMTKQALVGARTFEFSDHTTGSVVSHEVGHTMSQTYNDEFFSAKSWFKFDGKNIWDVVHDRGIRLSTNLHSKFPYVIYDVAKNGEPFARVETSGVYVHEDDAAQHGVNLPSGSMYYRFWTASRDFETLFLTIFAVSETEQAVVE